jgi:hypothetical protein
MRGPDVAALVTRLEQEAKLWEPSPLTDLLRSCLAVLNGQMELQKITACTYCGETTHAGERGTAEWRAAMIDHMLACEKRPEAKLVDVLFARPLVPHLLTFPCVQPKCDGLFTFTGRLYRQGVGPLINIHVCDRCGQELELADDYYPRLVYRDGSATVNINTGRVEP